MAISFLVRDTAHPVKLALSASQMSLPSSDSSSHPLLRSSTRAFLIAFLEFFLLLVDLLALVLSPQLFQLLNQQLIKEGPRLRFLAVFSHEALRMLSATIRIAQQVCVISIRALVPRHLHELETSDVVEFICDCCDFVGQLSRLARHKGLVRSICYRDVDVLENGVIEHWVGVHGVSVYWVTFCVRAFELVDFERGNFEGFFGLIIAWRDIRGVEVDLPSVIVVDMADSSSPKVRAVTKLVVQI